MNDLYLLDFEDISTLEHGYKNLSQWNVDGAFSLGRGTQ